MLLLPVEVEALHLWYHMIVAGPCVVEVISEWIVPASYQGAAVDKGGEGSGAAVGLPQAVGLSAVKFADKACYVAGVGT